MSQGEAVLMTLGSLQAMQSFPTYLLTELARNRPRMQRFGTVSLHVPPLAKMLGLPFSLSLSFSFSLFITLESLLDA